MNEELARSCGDQECLGSQTRFVARGVQRVENDITAIFITREVSSEFLLIVHNIFTVQLMSMKYAITAPGRKNLLYPLDRSEASDSVE